MAALALGQRLARRSPKLRLKPRCNGWSQGGWGKDQNLQISAERLSGGDVEIFTKVQVGHHRSESSHQTGSQRQCGRRTSFAVERMRKTKQKQKHQWLDLAVLQGPAPVNPSNLGGLEADPGTVADCVKSPPASGIVRKTAINADLDDRFRSLAFIENHQTTMQL